MHSVNLKHSCERLLGCSIDTIRPISGGDINEAFLLTSQQGEYFVKYNTVAFAYPMFKAEAKGLATLAAAECIRIPKVLAIGELEKGSLLLLEYIKSTSPAHNFWKSFGRALAQLHRCTQEQFGWEIDNYIGSLPQYNASKNNWPDFYRSQRLEPQLRQAIAHGRLSNATGRAFDRLFAKLEQICSEEPPALTHGDLWSGNFLVDENGQAVLIDPATAYTHREMDIAMTRLFGGFAPQFYAAYQEVYPQAPDFEERLPIYQLYYLLVHVNLFGGSYVGQVESILARYT